MVDAPPAGTRPLPPQTMDLPVRFHAEPLMIRCCENDTKIYVRTGTDDEQLRDLIAGFLNFSLPGPGHAVTDNNITALSTGPDEWMLVTSLINHQRLLDDLKQLVSNGRFLSCHDVSSATGCIQLDGHAAARIFPIATEVDLSPAIFPVGACTCLRFSQCSAILHRAEEGVYNVHVPRSYVSWVWDWLRAVA